MNYMNLYHGTFGTYNTADKAGSTCVDNLNLYCHSTHSSAHNSRTHATLQKPHFSTETWNDFDCCDAH